MLLSLPEDAVGHIVQFLAPVDFYAMKTATAAGHDANRLYWWTGASMTRACRAGCATLITWVGRADADLTATDTLTAAAVAIPHGAALQAVYDIFRRRWPDHLSRLMALWAEHGATRIFQYQAIRAPSCIDYDVFDTAYFYSRWVIMASAFRHAPRAFMRWAFGGYGHVDIDVIKNLRFVLPHLDAACRDVFCRILCKYHDWMWSHKTSTTDALRVIAALQNLEYCGTRVIPFHTAAYLDRAMLSPHADYLEYLLMCGLEAEPAIMHRTRDLDKLRVLMHAQVAQKFYKIIALIMVLIGAVILRIAMDRGVKIESPKRVNRHNGLTA